MVERKTTTRKPAVRKTTAKKKPTTTAKKTTKPQVKVEKPTVVKPTVFSYGNQDELKSFLGADEGIVAPLVKKFQSRYGVKLKYIHKCRAFKCFRGIQHVDWIELNDLMKRYDCRLPPVKMLQHPQRPFIKNRIY